MKQMSLVHDGTNRTAAASFGGTARDARVENTLTGNTRFRPGQGEAAVTGQSAATQHR